MFKIDFIDGKAIGWHRKRDNVEAESFENYNPTFYIDGDDSKLFRSRPWISARENVVATKYERWKPGLSGEETRVLRIDVDSIENLMEVVGELKSNFDRRIFRFYNVDFSPQFRFCLENSIRPVPENELRKIDLRLDRKSLARGDLSNLVIDGEKIGDSVQPFEALRKELKERDPDVLLVNRSQLLKILKEEAPRGYSIGRTGRIKKLAGENTVSSYGKTVHSNSRFNVPGRVVIDRSNSFMLGEATFEGLWDLVERSYRPIQELAWASIGRILTSIEARRAMERGIVTPWKNWSPETPKKANVLHSADRGGFIFSPEPGIYEEVYEADFASLFPNIMVKRNISPETVCCECCENSNVPELGYSICEKRRGFISEVLKPLVEDRQRMKHEVDSLEGEEKRKVKGSIDAIKWLLVSCFGYMGHAHASYGSIECHQAIQAFDREIMLEAKEIFERNGYSIIHGIIDSVWAQPKGGEKGMEEVCNRISESVGIEMEFEDRFDWIAFVPRSSSEQDIGSLNRYFGKNSDGEIITAGIEAEQDSEPDFVKEAQLEMIKSFDRTRKVQPVLDVLKENISVLERGEVPLEDLLIQKNVSQSLENYKVENKTVAAMKRYRNNGIEIKPGQKVSFVVRNDRAPAMDRVRLRFEADEYDSSFYRKKLVRAAESVLSPKGIYREDIRQRLEGSNRPLTGFVS